MAYPAPDSDPMTEDLDGLTPEQLEDRALGPDPTLRGIVRQRRETVPPASEHRGDVVFRVHRRTLHVLAGAGLFLIGSLASWVVLSDHPSGLPIEDPYDLDRDVYSASGDVIEIVERLDEIEFAMEMDEVEMVMEESEGILTED